MFEFFQSAFDFLFGLFEGIFNGIESLIGVVKNIFGGTSTFLSLISDILPFSNQVIARVPGVFFPVLLVCLGISIYKGVAHGS